MFAENDAQFEHFTSSNIVIYPEMQLNFIFTLHLFISFILSILFQDGNIFNKYL
jgi:hypothetical protein